MIVAAVSKHSVRVAVVLLPLLAAAGCALSGSPGCDDAAAGGPPPPGYVPALLNGNPMLVPVTDREGFWNALVDVVDDNHFRIDREQRVQQVGDVLTEGRIETLPHTPPTFFEPLRPDHTNPYETSLSTLQTLRRRATVRVMPQPAGYLVEVMVLKEQEALPQPENSRAGAAGFRHDGSLTRSPELTGHGRPPRVWYPVGRDIALEQKILAELRDCLGLLPGAPTASQCPAPYGPGPLP
jgi:hypothetical protein